MSEQDAWMQAYLESVRQKNKERFSKCHVCKGKATTVAAIKHLVLPSCEEHSTNG